ncbi:hypothetical protein Ddc_01394 [Ditylenchus destructor]|nr:hypothetical protein Ddc_01394 [Ditylenchus destructor]
MLRVVSKLDFLRIQSNEIISVKKITLGQTKYSAPSPSASLDENTTNEIPNPAFGSEYTDKTANQHHKQSFANGGQMYRKPNQYRPFRGSYPSSSRKTLQNYGYSRNVQKSNFDDLRLITNRIHNERKNAAAYYGDILDKVLQTQRLPDSVLSYLIWAAGQIKGHSIPDVRNKYLFNLMDKIKHKGHEVGIRSMNALLEVMIDNNEEVDVIDVLQVFERKGLDLNVKTYTELARAYAIQGNGNGILSILSHLKEEQQTSPQSPAVTSAENGYAQQNRRDENVIQPILNYLAYAEALCGQRENVYAIAKSAAQQSDLYTRPIILHAALGFAKKGDIKEVETIVQRTRVLPTAGHAIKLLVEIYMTLLHHTHDALEIMRPFLHLEHNGKLPERTNRKAYLSHAIKLVNSGKFAEMEQALQLINFERSVELHNFPAKAMLRYGIKMLDSGKPDKLEKILDAFKRPPPEKNTDDFFWHFIEEYFRRTGKPINVKEAWPMYLNITEDRNSATPKRKFHVNTIKKLLRLALPDKLNTRSKDKVSTYDKILQTIEECDSPAALNAIKQSMVHDIIHMSDNEMINKKFKFSDLVG